MNATLPVYKCGNCGANIKPESLTCEYCSTNFAPSESIVKTPKYKIKRVLFWTKRVKIKEANTGA